MRYAKLIDGVIYYAPKKIQDGDTVTYNPTPEMLLPLGYLPVVTTNPPEIPEGYYADYHWEEQDGEIVQVWEIVEDPYYYDATPDEIAEALEVIL